MAILTDEAGNVVERLGYDAWGKRRQPNGQDDPAGSVTSQTTRGFTGHEQLDDVGLNHMNGRVYDPLLGRFGTPFCYVATTVDCANYTVTNTTDPEHIFCCGTVVHKIVEGQIAFFGQMQNALLVSTTGEGGNSNWVNAYINSAGSPAYWGAVHVLQYQYWKITYGVQPQH